jgi:hypothetical protein
MWRARGSNNGRCPGSVGVAIGMRPPGSAAPVSTSAMACPPSMPGYQAIKMAGTFFRQASITTALPVMTTTTVRGLASATSRIRSSSRACSRSERRSPPGMRRREAAAATRRAQVLASSGWFSGGGAMALIAVASSAVRAVVVGDPGRAECRRDPGQGADGGWRADGGGAQVADVGPVGQPARHRDRPDAGHLQRQHRPALDRFVAQQDHSACRSPPGQRPVRRAGDHARRQRRPRRGRVCQLRRHDAGPRPFHVFHGRLAGAQRGRQVPGPLLAERHLQVLPGCQRAGRIAQAPDEVGHDKARETPLLAQDASEQGPVLALCWSRTRLPA